MNPAVLVLSAPFGRDASGVGAEATAMIQYKCPKCGVLMESLTAMAGQVEVCEACGARCRVPTPKPAPVDPDANIPWARPAAVAASARGRAVVPRCQLCGGSMDRHAQVTRHWALRVLGILIIIPHGGVGVGLIVLLAAGLARGEPQAAAGVAAMLLVVAYCAVPVLIGLALIGGSRKVWRCRSCGAVVPRA